MHINPIKSAFVRKVAQAAQGALPFAGALAAGVVLYHVSPEARSMFDDGREYMSHYPRSFELLTSAFTLGIIPDIMAQRYEGKRFDYFRLVGMTLVGSISGGILVREFYDYQSHWFPGHDVMSTLAKILVDQLLYTPFYLTFYFTAAKLIHRQKWCGWQADITGILKKVRDTLPLNWLYWGMALTIVYNLPVDLMVYAANSFSLVWFAFLSSWSHSANVCYNNKIK